MSCTIESHLQDWKLNELLSCIADQIHRSQELHDILQVAVDEVRAFLQSDRVMVYKFHPDESGQVIAESVDLQRLPSLLGLNFPADDIPSHHRELFVRSRVRSIVNVATGKIGQSFLSSAETALDSEDIFYRPVDACHQEYLTAMGVQSSVVVPIIHQGRLWGLLVAHHAEAREIPLAELQVLQMVVDQFAVAIVQAELLAQAQETAQRQAAINRIANLLHSLSTIELQAALEATVTALNGLGGRLYLLPTTLNAKIAVPGEAQPISTGTLYCHGTQPVLSEQTRFPCIEQYPIWCHHFAIADEQPWAITDLYQVSELRNLQPAFKPTNIRGMLVAPLHYRQQLLGYLTVFRPEVEVETLWAGWFDPDERQAHPRLSFEVWKESKQGQLHQWTATDVELARVLGNQFATAIQQYAMHQQVQAFNTQLESQVEERTAKLQLAGEQQAVLLRVVTKIRESLDLEHIFKTAVTEVRRSLRVDRVIVFRFDPNSNFDSGQVIAEDVVAPFAATLGRVVRDHCFGEQYATEYQQGKISAMANIHDFELQDCHLELLTRLQVVANLLVPLRKGNELWGLLGIHGCTGPRDWSSLDIQFATQIAAQLDVALQQGELLVQTQQQASELQRIAEQQQMLFDVVAKMRKSLDLETIFQTTTQGACQLLRADRVAVYRFNANWGGEFVSNFEAANPDWEGKQNSGITMNWDVDTYLQDTQGGRYRNNETLVVHDVDQSGFSSCHLETLAKFQVRAQIIAPIFVGHTLWGLLAAYQHSAPRHWTDSEVSFFTQVAVQLGVAYQQADLLSQTQRQAEQLTKALDDLKQAQTHLIQTEKMSSLGQLVAGIAHEINNPVNFIYGNLAHVSNYAQDLLGLVELYQQHYPTPASEICDRAQDIDLEFLTNDLHKTLSSMRIGADRIRQIVLSLRNFSRLDQAEMKPVDIHDGIDSTLLILQYRLKPKSDRPAIEIIKDYDDLPLVECYAGQLNQVFMNVLGNAIEALEEAQHTEHWTQTNETPTIRIQTSITDDRRVQIRFSDNGPGIPEAVRPRIFDPFFTTKPVGKGTGLGLSISYKIVVEKHGGIFRCESQPGQGTTFLVEVPAQPMLSPKIAPAS